MVRRRAGEGLRIVTPGIRSASDSADDQARTATPGAAIGAGADVLVVGRPVVRAPDPRRAAMALVAEIEQALAARP
jgi:orotidine-5'-phosphate decarboxylase